MLEIFEHQLKGTLVKANFPNKEFKILKVAILDENSDAALKKLLKKFKFLSQYRVILGLDSHLATTVYGSSVVVRDNFKEPIDEPDLDNLISQAVWKFFDRQRNKTAVKMNANDLDIVLSDVRIRGIKLDGHRVVNPAGFKAKSVEVQFSQTFLVREIFNKIKNLFPQGQAVFISENGSTWSNVISQSTPSPTFLLANIFKNKTVMFVSDRAQKSYWDNFPWGRQNVINSLAADLAVNQAISQSVIDLYQQNNMSMYFKKRLEQIFMKELQILANGLSLALGRHDAKLLYVNQLAEIPNILSPSFRGKFDRPVSLAAVHSDLISQSFGFQIKLRPGIADKNIFGALAYLLEWSLSPSEDKMSQIAKRRVRWLNS